MLEAELREVADRMDDVPLPAESMELIGHEDAVEQLAQSYRASKLHHAWLISGPKGIGKSTLAFHFARHIMANPDAASAQGSIDPATWPENLVRQVGQGGHPDLLHLTRPWDEKTKKFKTQLSVDEIRRTQAFYGMTAGAGGWRITIVDAADDMNASAANALLKILEEPPKRSLFLVISHAAGGLLPTIRSRCQALSLMPLSDEQVMTVIENAGLSFPEDELKAAAALAGGSARWAIQLANSDVLKHYQAFEKLMQKQAIGSGSEWVQAHSIADALSRRGAEESFSLFIDLVTAWIGRQVRRDAGHVATSVLAGLAEVWEKTSRSITIADAFNLDKKQVILSLFKTLFDAQKR